MIEHQHGNDVIDVRDREGVQIHPRTVDFFRVKTRAFRTVFLRGRQSTDAHLVVFAERLPQARFVFADDQKVGALDFQPFRNFERDDREEIDSRNRDALRIDRPKPRGEQIGPGDGGKQILVFAPLALRSVLQARCSKRCRPVELAQFACDQLRAIAA